MHLIATLVALGVGALGLSGCLLLNDVRPLSTGSDLNPDRAIVIYGVAVEGSWPAPQFQVSLDEYSPERQAITGDCVRFNRMQAAVAAKPGPPQYFSFDAKAGHYVYSAFNGASLSPAHTAWAFEVPKGRIVYLGDFVYLNTNTVEVRHNTRRVEATLLKLLGTRDVLAIKPTAVPPVGIFVCSP